MNLSVEQERMAFSDAEPLMRKRKPTMKGYLRRSSMSVSSSFDGNDEYPPVPPSPPKINIDLAQENKIGDGLCPLDEQHQGKKMLHVIVALPIDFIFAMIFVQDQVMGNVYEARKVTDVVNGAWQEEQEPGQMSRQVTYAMSINVANFGSKTSYVSEKQTILHSQSGHSYVVTVEALNSGIPYADSFFLFSHYCLIKEPDGRTKITVWTQVKYKKQIWGVVKSMLEKNAYNGVEAFEAELLSQITLIAERSERKGNRMPVTTKHKTHARTSSYGYKRQRAGKDITPKETKETTSHCNLWIAVSMILVFLLLIISNYILYNKLHYLELRSEQRIIKPPAARYLAANKPFESKSRFLRQYNEIQDEKLQTWKSTVSEASLQLQEIQESLELMLGNIRDNEEAMMSVMQEFNINGKVTIEKNAAENNSNDDVTPAGGDDR